MVSSLFDASDDSQYTRALAISFTLSAAVFLVVLLGERHAARPISLLRASWRSRYTAPALLFGCAFLAWFILHFGLHQFGGFDYNVLMELGWRQHLGQRPYTDFPASTPPGFNLGIRLAYALFGVSWKANLELSALFAVGTFLWLYWLLLRLALGRLAAFAVAFSIESAAMLTLCFWWYNNTTTILAAVFFLSSLVCAQELVQTGGLRSLLSRLSWVLSLAALSLFKPNMAGIVIVAGILLLLVTAGLRNVLGVVSLTLAAATLAVGTLALNGISIPTLMAVYRSVAGERGFALIGFFQMRLIEQVAAFYWIAALSVSLAGLGHRLRSQWKQRHANALAISLFLLVGPILAVYGVATNGEFRDVECTVLLAAGGVAVFGMRLGGPRIRRVFLALLAASVASELYLGAIRLRVDAIGPHMFFEWTDNDHVIPSGVLRGMRVSATMIEVEREVAEARDANPGPWYLGPRVDFNYSVLNIPSPIGLPAWWHPGTAFARSRIPALLQVWEQDRFATLIYLKGDYTYYPDAFVHLIQRDYIRDDRYPCLTVYHRRPGPITTAASTVTPRPQYPYTRRYP